MATNMSNTTTTTTTNDRYVQELLHPVESGIEVNPTILSVIMILKSKATKPHELDVIDPTAEILCMICRDSLTDDPNTDLVTLSCGHLYCRSCIDGWLTHAISWIYPRQELAPGYEDDYEEEADSNHPEQVEYDNVDIPRTGPECRHIIFPLQGYDWTKCKEGIAPEEAQWILQYFEDPRHGQERKERLNDDNTLGTELQAAHDWARWQYTSELQEEEEPEEMSAFAADIARQNERRAASTLGRASRRRSRTTRSLSPNAEPTAVNAVDGRVVADREISLLQFAPGRAENELMLWRQRRLEQRRRGL